MGPHHILASQVHYMTVVMKLNYYIGVFFLLLSAATQLGSSILVLRPEMSKPSRVKPVTSAPSAALEHDCMPWRHRRNGRA